MKEEKPSVTAVFAAMSRAAHLFFDGEPKILRDDFALGLSGLTNEGELKKELEALKDKFGQIATPELAKCVIHSMRGFAALRHRFAEDGLTEALERGVSQYVILGAGLDSFAYRRRDLGNKLRIFEVDYPATQQWKKKRLQELDIKLPRNLTFVPVDFEKQNLIEGLYACGLNKKIPAFFSWLGVTCYLTEAAVFQTLHEIVTMPPGTEIVFDYALPDSILGEGERQIWALGRATPNEPDITQFEPYDLAAHLKEIGFSRISHFNPEEANKRYFNGRDDDLSASRLDRLYGSVIRLYHLMKARV